MTEIRKSRKARKNILKIYFSVFIAYRDSVIGGLNGRKKFAKG